MVWECFVIKYGAEEAFDTIGCSSFSMNSQSILLCHAQVHTCRVGLAAVLSEAGRPSQTFSAISRIAGD